MARRRAAWPWLTPLAVPPAVRSAIRTNTKAWRDAIAPAPTPPPRGPGDWLAGLALAPGGMRRYRLYRPPGVRFAERLPLLVMLHGCQQDAAGFAAITRMNALAARKRFLVLYPEQDRRANPQGCWNWYETRSGLAQQEAQVVLAAVQQACLRHAADPTRVAIAGLSAGASLAALVATRYPERFQAVALHSGVPPGTATSSAEAFGAMRGRRLPDAPPTDAAWPPLLVIHGGEDRVVSARNAAATVQLWADAAGAAPRASRQVQRGHRHAMTVTDYTVGGRTVVTHCEVGALGHAWSGGAASRPFSDAQGPDASRLVWSFVSRQFPAPG